MIKLEIKEEDRMYLPAHQVFWTAAEMVASDEYRVVSINKYNTKKARVQAFYKPISRVFSISTLFK